MGAGMKRTPESHPDQAALIGKIKAHIDKGDKAKAQAEHAAGKAEQHYISAGQYLKTLKEQHNGSWAEWEELLKTKIGIGKSRASELMAIADGTKTTKQVRADTNKRKITHRTSPFRNGETRRERQRKANAECERDREACIALDQKVTSAERELAQWLANHPYPDPIVAEWLKGSEPAEQVVEEPVAKPKPEATLNKLFDELFFGPTNAAPPEREAVQGREAIGSASTGEAERLRARVDELQSELRLREIKIAGLESEIEELKAKNVELHTKLAAAGAPQGRPSTNSKGKEENGARGNDAPASAGKRKAEFALDDGSDPGPIPDCLVRAARNGAS
jgi:hypothetical protein